jgi:1-acyl-sn-glycerol-3-phosphate acyltransferase
MRTVLTVIVMMIATPTLAAVVIVAGLLGVPNRPGGVYDRVPRLWSRLALWLAGVRLVLHGDDTLRQERPRVFVSNHVSWYDIFTLLAILPRYREGGAVQAPPLWACSPTRGDDSDSARKP